MLQYCGLEKKTAGRRGRMFRVVSNISMPETKGVYMEHSNKYKFFNVHIRLVGNKVTIML